ncbi:hypothetical protein RHGRI_000421 [Rhododendron griersonianum]|uniref:RNase H type-1 domain-containing protein n=1 Tax=Rhododendron griersonianum TaxID=479676 RepID=A0AAV6LHK8_9ERIC|nr:hypothetical protein RHGRI_000421 [Rhododendron griersonianum]
MRRGWDRLLSERLHLNIKFKSSIKLNTDGCWYESNSKLGFGGLFRDSKGNWILGFFGKLVCDSSLEVELWAIYRGFTIILEKSLANVTIESDSLVVVELINEGTPGNHAQSIIITEAMGC